MTQGWNGSWGIVPIPSTVVRAGKSRVERQEGHSGRCDLAPNARSNTGKLKEQPKLIRRQAWQGMFVCLILICALNAESKPLKESKDYVFVAEKQEDRFWQVWLWTILKNAQRFAPKNTVIVCTRERQVWSLEVHNVRTNPSSLKQNYKIHCVHYPYLSVTERLGLSHPLTNWISFFCHLCQG